MQVREYCTVTPVSGVIVNEIQRTSHWRNDEETVIVRWNRNRVENGSTERISIGVGRISLDGTEKRDTSEEQSLSIIAGDRQVRPDIPEWRNEFINHVTLGALREY
jgi:hypothetical protein